MKIILRGTKKTVLCDTVLLTPAEAAPLVGVTAKTLSRNERNGRVRAVRTPNGARRFYWGELAARQAGQPLSDAEYAALIDRAVRQR